jgi:hypothetical protein
MVLRTSAFRQNWRLLAVINVFGKPLIARWALPTDVASGIIFMAVIM